MIKSLGFEELPGARVTIPALPFIAVVMNKILKFSVFVFPYLFNDNNNSSYISELLLEINELIHIETKNCT